MHFVFSFIYFIFFCRRLHVDIIGVSAATQEEAEEDAAADYQEETEQDVDQRGGPKGKQVERLVAVGTYICCVLVVVGLIN